MWEREEEMSVRRDLREGSDPVMQSQGWVRGAGKGECGDKTILLLAESFSSSSFFWSAPALSN